MSIGEHGPHTDMTRIFAPGLETGPDGEAALNDYEHAQAIDALELRESMLVSDIALLGEQLAEVRAKLSELRTDGN